MPAAVVRITNTATGVTREALTNEEGLFRALNLAAGAYRVEVGREGFRTAVREGVTLGISETARTDFVLEVGAIAERVNITEKQTIVETEQGRVSARIDTLQLKELPLNGRNLYNLVALQPGVAGRGISQALGAGGPARLSREARRKGGAGWVPGGCQAGARRVPGGCQASAG